MKVARRAPVTAPTTALLPWPAWLVDTAGRALDCNAALLAWCGLDAAALAGEGWLTLVHAEDRDALHATLAGGGAVTSQDARLRRADGKWRWLRLALGATEAGTLLSAQDVTDLVVARDEAHDAWTLQRRIFDHIPAFVLVKDEDNNVLDANRAANRYFTGAEASMRGHSCYEMFPPAQAETWHAQDRAVLTSGEPLLGVVEELRDGGPPRWHRMDKLPFTLPGVPRPLCLVMGVEISAERALELRLREQVEDSEALLRVLRQREYEQNLILDNIPVLILYKDTDNRILRANRYAADLLGVPQRELEGRPLAHALPRDAAGLYRHDLEVLRSRQAQSNIEMEITTRRGVKCVLRLHHLPCCDATGALTRIVVVGEDITLTRHYERELEARATLAEGLVNALERRSYELQLIFDHVPARIVYKDIHNHLVRANRYTAEFVGLPLEALEGRHLRDIYGVEAAERYYADDLEVLRTRRPLSNLIEHFDVPSGRRWLRTEKVPIFDAGGEITGIIAMSVDITAQQLAENELRRQRAELQLLLDHSPAAILSHDGDGRVVRANRTAALHLGRAEHDVVGRQLRELFGPHADEWQNEAREAMRTGRSLRRWNVPARTALSGGAVTYWQTETVPVLDDSGRACGVLHVAHDTTEHKRVEDELRRQKEEMQLILDHVPTAIMVKDAENNLLRVNRAAADHLGRRPEDMNGEPSERFFPDPDGRFWQEDLNVMRSRRPRFGLIWRTVQPNGAPRTWRYHKIPYFDCEGHAIGVLVVAEDHGAELAAREALEDSLATARRLEGELRALFDALPLCVALKSPAGRLLRVNRAAADFLGEAPAALLGQDLCELLDEGAEDCCVRDRAVLASGEPQFDAGREVRLRDGRRRRLQFHRARYADAGGTVLGVLIAFRDITADPSPA